MHRNIQCLLKMFNFLIRFQLSSILECRPPISKAKMTSITKSALKAIKFYKHVVQSVEKFVQKVKCFFRPPIFQLIDYLHANGHVLYICQCKPEYKVPGLYVIDSIVRQSRHQHGPTNDVFAPRFSKNIKFTLQHLFKCPEDQRVCINSPNFLCFIVMTS